MLNKSGRTTLIYLLAILVVVMLVAFKQHNEVNASSKRINSEYELVSIEEVPHAINEVEIYQPQFILHKDSVAGKVIVCCYLNPLYKGFSYNNDQVRALEYLE